MRRYIKSLIPLASGTVALLLLSACTPAEIIMSILDDDDDDDYFYANSKNICLPDSVFDDRFDREVRKRCRYRPTDEQ